MINRMNVNGHEIELDELENEYEYGEEIMNAGWNPAVDLVSEQLQEVRADEQLVRAAELSGLSTREDIAEAGSEMFMRKMYSYLH